MIHTHTVNDWPSLVPGDIDANIAADARRAVIRESAERVAVAAGCDVVRVVDASGHTLDAWPVSRSVVIDGAWRTGAWLEFPSMGVRFAPGDGHGWRAARVLEVGGRGGTARVEWWNRLGVRHECSVSLAKCRRIAPRTAPTPDGVARRLREEARARRADRRNAR